MTEIKRYEFDILHSNGGGMTPAPGGGYVIYRDHTAIVSALLEQVLAMAAENSALARYFSASSVAVNHWNSWADTEDKLACAPETTATDAALREIRAQGAIEARNALVVAGDGADIYAVVTDVATRIRAGEQP